MSLEQKYNIVFAGAIKEGFDAAAVQNDFVRKLKLSENKVPLYFSGKRVVLKRALSKAKAETLRKKLVLLGAETIIVPYIGEADKEKAKTKNSEYTEKKHLNVTRSDENKNSHHLSTEADVRNVSENFTDLLEEKELQKKIALAQSMMLENQLKSQLENKSPKASYKKLTYLSFLLAIAIFLLYFYTKGGL